MNEFERSRLREMRRTVAERAGSEGGSARDTGTWIALAMLVVLGGGLLGLMTMVAPQLLGVVLVLGGFVGFGALHYLLWGWWLKKALQEREPSSEGDSWPEQLE